jgi:hypothetical protein
MTIPNDILSRRAMLAIGGAGLVPLLTGYVDSSDDRKSEHGGAPEPDDEDRESDAGPVDTTDGITDLQFGDEARTSFDNVYIAHGIELIESDERDAITREWPDTDGRQDAVVTVEIRNEHDDRVELPRADEFSILTDDNAQFVRDVYGYDGEYDGGAVPADCTREGVIVFQIPEDLALEELTVQLRRGGRDPDGNLFAADLDVRWSL